MNDELRDLVITGTVIVVSALALAIVLPFEIVAAGIVKLPEPTAIVQVKASNIDPSVDSVMIALCDTKGDAFALGDCRVFMGRVEATFRGIPYGDVNAVIARLQNGAYYEMAASPIHIDRPLNVISFDKLTPGTKRCCELPYFRWC